MTSTPPVRVLLIDDHALLRETLRDRLGSEDDLQIVAVAATAEEGLRTALRERPQVVVMDIDMPGRVCFDVARDMVAQLPDVRIVYLSAFYSDRYIEDALAAHAVSYVTKSEPPDVLVTAIRQAARGVAYFSPQVRNRLVVDSHDRLRLERDGEHSTLVSTLTPRELEMLRYLARGLSKKEIAATIHRSYGTVDKHIEKLMRKLNIHDRVALTLFAVREGLAEP